MMLSKWGVAVREVDLTPMMPNDFAAHVIGVWRARRSIGAVILSQNF
jgi:hypothetical protein